MPLPREQVFNELNGIEVKRLLEDRVAALLATVPYLQRHLTLPRVRMTVAVELVVRADQEGGDVHRIEDTYVVRTDAANPVDELFDIRLSGRSVVNAAPGRADSKTPGQLRYEAGLADAVPVRGPVATEDAYAVAGDVPVVVDKSFGRLPTEQEKIAAHKEQQAARVAASLPPPEEPVTLPGVMVERDRHKGGRTVVTQDRGGPALTGPQVPVEQPTFKNAGAAPDTSAREEFRETRETGVSKGNRRD